MGKIYWTKNNGDLDFEREPPFPDFNKLEDKIKNNSSCYVNQSMMWSAWTLWENASKEILAEDKRLRKQIEQKNEQIKALEKELSKWTSQQKGKKPILTEQQKEQITEWKKMEISNREIAKRLEVSEGTIRNFLKGF